MVPLRNVLKSGDTVEVMTSKKQTPTKDWLNIVRSSRAKTKIKQWLLKIERERNQEVGKDVLEKAFRVYNTSLKNTEKNGDLQKAVSELNCANMDDLYMQVGAAKIGAKEVITKALSLDLDEDKKISEIDKYSKTVPQKARRQSHKDDAVIVDGLDNIMVRMAKCCNPIPGDTIVGYITRGRGVTVHTSNCKRIDQGELDRKVFVEWNPDFHFKHPVNIKVITHDRPGILSQISNTINDTGVNIRSALAKSLPDRKGSFIFEIEVKDYSELYKAISHIESLEEVIAVNRV